MSQLQGFGSIYAGALAMGFFYGLTLCSFSCLPLMGPYIMGTSAGFRQGFDAMAAFIIARVLGYTLMGGLAGLAGEALMEHIGLRGPAVAAGVAIIAIGLVVLLRPRRGCASHAGLQAFRNRHAAILGLATSLMPCPPLYAVMLYAATTQSMATGAMLAFAFAFGTAASPLYYLGGAAGWLSGRMKEETQQRYNDALRLLSAGIIAAFGAKLVLSAAIQSGF